eukprot:scaffold90565_cov49-Phaeocystis_antarctica.AAC.1
MEGRRLASARARAVELARRLGLARVAVSGYSIGAADGVPKSETRVPLPGRALCGADAVRDARSLVDRLLAVQDEQHDPSRAHAGIVGEELPRGFEAVGDRGFAVRRHLVDPRVDHGRVVRPWHARRRI